MNTLVTVFCSTCLFLLLICDSDSQTLPVEIELKGHDGPIYALTVCKGGKILASAGDDGDLKIWDLVTGNELVCFTVDLRPTSVAFDSRGLLLASGGWDKLLRIWDIAKKKPLHALKGHTEAISAVAVSPENAWVASTDKVQTVRLWDPALGKEVHCWQLFSSCLAFSPDGKSLAVGCSDKTIRLIDVASKNEFAKLEGHAGNVEGLRFTPDGKTLAAYCGFFSPRHEVIVWDVPGKAIRKILEGFQKQICALDISPEGKFLAVADYHVLEKKSRLKIFSMTNLKEVGTVLDNSKGKLRALAFTSDCNHLAITLYNKVVILDLRKALKAQGP